MPSGWTQCTVLRHYSIKYKLFFPLSVHQHPVTFWRGKRKRNPQWPEWPFSFGRLEAIFPALPSLVCLSASCSGSSIFSGQQNEEGGWKPVRTRVRGTWGCFTQRADDTGLFSNSCRAAFPEEWCLLLYGTENHILPSITGHGVSYSSHREPQSLIFRAGWRLFWTLEALHLFSKY